MLPPDTLVPEPAIRTAGGLRVWIDGRVLEDPATPVVGAADHGLVVGDGVFEVLKVTRAGAFAITRHLRRMRRSAAALGLPAPDDSLVRSGIDAVLDGASYEHGRLRITYTGGRGPLGSNAPYGPPTLVVAAEEAEPAAHRTAIATPPWRRNEHGALTGVKSTSYAGNVRALAWAAERGASEAVFLNTAGQVCEGTGSNLFVVFGDTVVTPPLGSGPLAGITRELLLEWTDVVERDVSPEEAAGADEAFLTSTLRDVQAVERWDDRTLADRHEVTDRLAELFAQRSGADLDP